MNQMSENRWENHQRA